MMSNRVSTMSSCDVMFVVESRRIELEMTQEELASLSGVNRRTMNACLSGHSEISLRLLLRIVAALHLTLQLSPEAVNDR